MEVYTIWGKNEKCRLCTCKYI